MLGCQRKNKAESYESVLLMANSWLQNRGSMALTTEEHTPPILQYYSKNKIKKEEEGKKDVLEECCLGHIFG